MPHSLRAKLKGLNYKKLITDRELERLCKALDNEDVLDKIRAEIKAKIEEEEFARSVFRREEKETAKAEQCTGSIFAYKNVIRLIDKYKAESEDKE